MAVQENLPNKGGKTSRERLAWPDLAKGLSIVGVVLLHITLMVPEGQTGWLWKFNELVGPLRMPLFFVVSGFFSAKVLNMSLKDLVAKRLWFLLVPYVVWVSLELWLNRWHFHIVFERPLLSKEELFTALVLGHNMGWFLHALIIFNLALWATKKAPTWLAMILSVIVPLACLPWHTEYHFVSKALMYLPIFFAGAYFRSFIARYADALESGPRRGEAWSAFVVSIGLYTLGRSARKAWDEREFETFFEWPLGNAEWIGDLEVHYFVQSFEQLVKLPAAIALVVILTKIPGISAFLQAIGRNTLPLYLAHPIALTLCVGIPITLRGIDVTLDGQWPLESTVFWISVGIVASVIGGVALWGVGKLPVIQWLLYPPSIRMSAQQVKLAADPINQAPFRNR